MQHPLQGAGSYATVGLELALSVMVGLWIGQALDGWLGTGGWMTFLWLVFGVMAGYRAVWRALVRANREADLAEAKDREARKQFHERRNPPP